MRSWLPFPDMRTISLGIGQIAADEGADQARFVRRLVNLWRLVGIGTAIILPIVLAYGAFAFWVFRGKVGSDAGYGH